LEISELGRETKTRERDTETETETGRREEEIKRPKSIKKNGTAKQNNEIRKRARKDQVLKSQRPWLNGCGMLVFKCWAWRRWVE
jgi:hypothetical protein